jgi:predicted PhzF superfamily epimerase YddE/YHI9
VPADEHFALRWFTPSVEVDLCGHATLASAHALWESGAVPTGRDIEFHMRSGRLVCSKSSEFIEMDFPARTIQSTEPDDELR